MSEEQNIEITQNGSYLNLDLKPKHNQGIKGLEAGNYVIVEKIYAEAYEIQPKNEGQKPFYSAKVKYKGQEPTFLLSQAEHDQFKITGGIGDKVKITLSKESRINPKTNVEMLISVLNFERV